MPRMLKANVIEYTNELIERYAFETMQARYYEAEGNKSRAYSHQDVAEGIMSALILFGGFSGQGAEALRVRAKDEAGKRITERMKEGRWPRTKIG